MKKIIIWAIALGLLVVAACGGLFYYGLTLTQAVDPHSDATITYIVEPGANLTQISQELKELQLIKDTQILKYYTKLTKTGDSIQAGSHVLSPSTDLAHIIAALESTPEQVTITILPGWRREEIAEYLTTLNLPDFDASEFIQLTQHLEGRLSPDTYKIAPLSTAQTIVNILTEQFDQIIGSNAPIQAKVTASGRSFTEILTIASLLQREGKTPEEMRMIAGVLNNRLADDFPLQLCASAQYATGKDATTGKWWEPPTVADTQTQSPYNTYVNPGLPPGPISSISLAALESALDPTANDYYFYLHDDSGQIHYGITADDHQANINAYLN